MMPQHERVKSTKRHNGRWEDFEKQSKTSAGIPQPHPVRSIWFEKKKKQAEATGIKVVAPAIYSRSFATFCDMLTICWPRQLPPSSSALATRRPQRGGFQLLVLYCDSGQACRHASS